MLSMKIKGGGVKAEKGKQIGGTVRIQTYLCRRAFDFGDRVF